MRSVHHGRGGLRQGQEAAADHHAESEKEEPVRVVDELEHQIVDLVHSALRQPRQLAPAVGEPEA